MTQYPRLGTEQYTLMPRLDYTITEVKVSFLYDTCKKYLLQQYDSTPFRLSYEAQDDSRWGAQEVYRLVTQDYGALNQYLLCYKDCIVDITFNWDPTAEQMAIVGSKLSDEK